MVYLTANILFLSVLPINRGDTQATLIYGLNIVDLLILHRQNDNLLTWY